MLDTANMTSWVLHQNAHFHLYGRSQFLTISQDQMNLSLPSIDQGELAKQEYIFVWKTGQKQYCS